MLAADYGDDHWERRGWLTGVARHDRCAGAALFVLLCRRARIGDIDEVKLALVWLGRNVAG
jgi:hypothetical protein